MMRRLLFRLVWHVPLGPLAPFVLALTLGRKPIRIEDDRPTAD